MREVHIVAIAAFFAGCIQVPPAPLASDAARSDAADAAEGDAAEPDAAEPDAAEPDAAEPDATPVCTDEDDDGYLAEGCASALPFDCDDHRANIGPGALEICGDPGNIDES